MPIYPNRPSNEEWMRAEISRLTGELDRSTRRTLKPLLAEGGVVLRGRVLNITATNNVFERMGEGNGWDSLFDPTESQNSSDTDRFAFRVGGWYEVIAQTGWAGNSSGLRAINVSRNGTVLNGLAPQIEAVNNSGGNFSLAGVFHLNGTTDYVAFTVRQTSGGNLLLEDFTVQVRFSHRD